MYMAGRKTERGSAQRRGRGFQELQCVCFKTVAKFRSHNWSQSQEKIRNVAFKLKRMRILLTQKNRIGKTIDRVRSKQQKCKDLSIY